MAFGIFIRIDFHLHSCYDYRIGKKAQCEPIFSIVLGPDAILSSLSQTTCEYCENRRTYSGQPYPHCPHFRPRSYSSVLSVGAA